MTYNTKDTNQDEIKAFLAQMPSSYRGVYQKAMAGKSLRAAVNAKCQSCGGWKRVEVRDCTVVTCPLYPYRPYQQHDKKTGDILDTNITERNDG